MSKKKLIKGLMSDLRESLLHQYENIYFNYFIDNWKWEGLDKIQSDYIMRKFWSDGTVASFPIKHTDELGFTTYATQKYNMYDMPEVVQLINKWNVPFMPLTPQAVNKDVVIGWAQTNHKPIYATIKPYLDRIVNIEMVINTNLSVHKLPWLITVSPEDKDKAQDILDRILNDEVVVFADMQELALVKEFAAGAPYIIDKLYQYKISIENELLTYLGIDNNSMANEGGYQLVDQVNANNAIINLAETVFKNNLDKFCEDINTTFGKSISVEGISKPVDSVYDEGNDVRGAGQEEEDE